MKKMVSVIIPNYNGRHLLEANLPAVLDMLRDGDELVIIDDASTDDSWKWLQQKFPNKTFTVHKKKIAVCLLQNTENMRFAKSCNKAVQQAAGEYVFLLNSDVSPRPDVLPHLLSHFDDPQVFGVGCLEIEHVDGKTVYGGKKELWFEKGMFIHARAAEFSTGETKWISGGSSLFDKQKWLELGGFDEEYSPAYWEDTDLSFRARKKGWKVMFDADAKVNHNHETTNQTAFGQKKIAEIGWRNSMKFLQKNGSFAQKVQHVVWKPYWWIQWQRHHGVNLLDWGLLSVLFFAVVLRFYNLGAVPHGMTWDEAAIGYNGFAIFHTRRDEWLVHLPITFQSFGDYKAPLAIYLNGIFTFLFGMNLWAVRLPFAIAGVLAVIGFMMLTRLLVCRYLSPVYQDILTLLAGVLIAFSPWHLQFSRIGMESGIALSFLIWGVYSTFRFLDEKKNVQQGIFLVTAVFCFVASLYTYHSAKIVVPLLALTILFLEWKRIWRKKVPVAVGSFLGIGLLYPLIHDALYANGAARLNQTSVVALHIPLFQKIILIGQNFLMHFTFQYLVLGATTTLRHGEGQWGVLFPITFLLVLCGVFAAIHAVKKKNWTRCKFLALAILWIVVGTLPAAIGTEVPHPNRMLLALPGFLLLALLGTVEVFEVLSTSKLNQQVSGSKGEKNLLVKSVIGTLLLFHGLFILGYLHDYYTVFAARSATDFNDGYIQAMQVAAKDEPTVDKILFTSNYGQPYIYALFVRKTSPIYYQGGSLIKYEFTDKINDGDRTRKNTLLVGDPTQLHLMPGDRAITDSDGQVKFIIVKTPNQ